VNDLYPMTRHGKAVALEALRTRREHYAKVTLADNASLPAGSPMYFACIACGMTIVVGEGYISKPSLCPECEALRECGWLE